MAKKAVAAAEKNKQVQSAIALALISAPNPFDWDNKTISISNIVEEVRKFLGWHANQKKRILEAIKKAVAEWLPASWLIYDVAKACITVEKQNETIFEQIANQFSFS